MPSSNQYTATGPSIVGFQTDGAHIQTGAAVAGTSLGLQGTGPTGVLGQGQGNSGIGVHGVGQGTGAGVLGQGGDAGPGGKFVPGGDLSPQIHLQPNAMPQNVGTLMDVQPQQIGKLPPLPLHGTAGDFFLGRFETPAPGCALWLCVTSEITSGQGSGAEWCQVLLGHPSIKGTEVPSEG